MSPVNSQAAGLISLNIVLPLTATVAVALRMVSIRVRKRTLQAHDFLCVLSLVRIAPMTAGSVSYVQTALFVWIYYRSHGW